MKRLLPLLVFSFAGPAQARQFQCQTLDPVLWVEVDLDQSLAGVYDGQSLSRLPDIGFPQADFRWFKGLATNGEMYEITVQDDLASSITFSITQFHKTTSLDIKCKSVKKGDLEILGL